MSNILEYKGYRAKVNYSCEDNVLFGKIEGINSLVTFEAESVDEVRSSFEEAVDNYLTFCRENGISPEKEYKGCFNVRVSPEVHKRITLEADKENISLNKYVEKALVNYLDRDKQKDYDKKFVVISNNMWVKEEKANSSYIYDYLRNAPYIVGGIKQ